MEQYIPKSAVVAEIERLFERAGNSLGEYRNGAEHTLISINDFLDTLEMKEVDLEKYYHDFLQKEWFGKNCVRTMSEMMAFTAKHFFELGLQARIDKELVEEVYSHLDSIKDTADRMTSGNFMHNRAAIKFSANTIAKVLELIGLKVQKGE